MNHIEVILTLLTLFSGFMSLVLLLFLNNKYKKPALVWAILFFSPFHIGFLFYFAEAYITGTNSQLPPESWVILWNGAPITYGFFIIPLALHKILNIKISQNHIVIFCLFALMKITEIILELSGNETILIYWGNIIEVGLFIYMYVLIKRNVMNINVIPLQSFMGKIAVLITIMLPFLIVDNFFYYQVVEVFGLFALITPLRSFYLFSNILVIISIFSFFHLNPDEQKSEDFLRYQRIYNFTKRELELIPLIIKGLTAKEIGEKLFITTQTVKNHTHRIYKKVGARNKVEFMNTISKMDEPVSARDNKL